MVRMAQPPQLRSSSHRPAGLVALDLDGTVLSPTGQVTGPTRAAIQRLIAQDTAVAIATGRSWWESRTIIAELGVAGPGIFAGGAIINEMSDGRSIASSRMPLALAQDICRLVHEAGLTAMVLQDRWHAEAEWLIAAEREMPFSMPEWLAHHGSSFHRVPNLATAQHEWTVRISTIASRERHAEMAIHLKQALGDRVYLHEIIVPASGVSVMEIFDSHVNKWTGIERVAAELGVPHDAIVAVGDDMNDLQMLERSALGVAMGNARPEVKAVARYTIGSNAEDGLAAFLEQLADRGLDAMRRPGTVPPSVAQDRE